MTCATSLAPNQLWKENKKVALYDQAGKLCEGRHGTVRTITDSNAIAIIMRMYRNAGYTYNPNVDKPSALEMNGWFRSNGRRYYFENGVKFANREWCDPATGEWYWFDADGSMARNKEVFIPFNADRTEGKWVYYDDAGHMVKGESFHGEQWNYYDIGTNKYWYYYDIITGIMHHGWTTLPDGRSYYYDEITGIRQG